MKLEDGEKLVSENWLCLWGPPGTLEGCSQSAEPRQADVRDSECGSLGSWHPGVRIGECRVTTCNGRPTQGDCSCCCCCWQ